MYLLSLIFTFACIYIIYIYLTLIIWLLNQLDFTSNSVDKIIVLIYCNTMFKWKKLYVCDITFKYCLNVMNYYWFIDGLRLVISSCNSNVNIWSSSYFIWISSVNTFDISWPVKVDRYYFNIIDSFDNSLIGRFKWMYER